MHILFTYGLVGRGGDAVQVVDLANALRRLGHVTDLVGVQSLRPYDFSGAKGRLRSAARRLPWWARDVIELSIDRRLWLKARRLLKNQSYDMVFHRAGIYDTVGARLARMGDCSLIAWLDAPFPAERRFHNQGYFKSLHRQCILRLGQQSKLIVTVSKASKEYYVELGLPDEKVLVVPNGIPQGLLQRGSELARKYPPFQHSKQHAVIGFVGSLSRWHGVGLLFEALRELGTPRDHRWRVKIVGYGEDYASLHVRARKLGLEAYIDWLGALPHEQAVEEIAQFDIAVLPNTLPTGTPIKLFEYAALARPIIAPDLPNIRERFLDDEMLFFRPDDPSALAQAILTLAEDPEMASQMGSKAQRRAHMYSWERIVKGILDRATTGSTNCDS